MKVLLTKTRSEDKWANVALRCPHCGHYGTFERLSGIKDVLALEESVLSYFLGLRRCPNAECHGHLFFIADHVGLVNITYPNSTIPFNKENIPEKILNAFSEAISCHSNNCFIASAIMIRKTLEEICKDRGAVGKTLYDRLQDLSTKIVVPKELRDGMQELRLLGNDAAHIESNTFGEIGKEEIEVSIEFTQEILKAVYQYESLLGKLRGLKKANVQEAEEAKKV
ncbi:DUF4145 domain-containing protein [Parapedobacter deserti]|uniref:DUF4145 domain-containing protein n=1 Tax=Parapedobacter deserti TaxID=1912957 RepID=A0ABV7JKC7_9SPHI